jgi:diacylglycerol kinase (ATP)
LQQHPNPAPHPELADERVLAVLSPGALTQYELLKHWLPEVFPRVQLIAPRDLLHLHELVRRSAATHRLVLACGGDGTLHHCLAALDLEQQVLGILPCGSGNDFASCLGFPRGMRQAIGHLSGLGVRATDIGLANGSRYINSAGFGIDTETLKLRRRSGRLWQRHYKFLFIRALARMQPLPIRLSWSGSTDTGVSEEQAGFFWVLAMNSPVIGGGTRIAPLSRLDDGLLDMVCIRRVGKLELLRRMPDAIAGRHLELADLTLFRQVTSISVELDRPLDYLALDGELTLCSQSRLTFSVMPRALSFLR